MICLKQLVEAMGLLTLTLSVIDVTCHWCYLSLTLSVVTLVSHSVLDCVYTTGGGDGIIDIGIICQHRQLYGEASGGTGKKVF